MAALPIQSDRCNDLINSYNQVWENSDIAWIKKKENGEFQAIKRLAFLTPTAERVQKAVNDTDKFIGKYKGHLSQNIDHGIFLNRVNQSFLKEFYGYEIDTTDLSEKISSIFCRSISFSHTDENLHDKLEMYHIRHPISSDCLPYDKAKYKEIDIIFVVDGMYAYPAHSTKFLERGGHWREVFNGHNNIVQIPSEAATPNGLLSFLHAIYRGTYPDSVEGLLDLEKCARYFHGVGICQKCERLVGRELGYRELQDLWKYMQVVSEKGELRNRIEYKYASAVINAEIEEVTPEMVNKLLECETLPCSEIELLRFLEKWTEHPERDIVSYLDNVRFEWMNLEDFIETVVSKRYLNDASEKLYFEVIQERQKNGKFPAVRYWEPRNCRSSGEVQIVDNSTESTIKKTLRVKLPLTKEQLKLRDPNRTIVKSQTFLMFAEKWSIFVEKNSKRRLRVVLKRKTANIDGRIEIDCEFKIEGERGREQKDEKHRRIFFSEGWKICYVFGVDGAPSLDYFINNNHINVTFNIEVDPKTLVYGKPS